MADWRNPHSGNRAGAQSMHRPISKFMKTNAAFAVFDAYMNMAEGDDFGTAALKAGAGAALWATSPWVMGAHLAATTIPQGLAAFHQWNKQKVNQWNLQHMQGSIGGNYIDTQRALTMRQAAVQAIESSKMNAHSALGGEAKIHSQSWHK